MDQISTSPGRAQLELLSESQVELRRSQRLMEKEAESFTKAGSPQLFEQTDEDWSQPLCQQKQKLPQIVTQEQRVGVKRRLSSTFVKKVPLKRRRGRPSTQETSKNAKNSISFYHELQRSQSEVVKSASQWELREQRRPSSEQSSLQLFEEIDAECSQLHSTQDAHLKQPIQSLHSSLNDEQLKAQTENHSQKELATSFFVQNQRPCTSQLFGETAEEQSRSEAKRSLNCTNVDQVVPIKRRMARTQTKTQPEVMEEQCPSTASPIEDNGLLNAQLHLMGRAYKEHSQRETIFEQQEDFSNVSQKVLPLKPSTGGSSTQAKKRKSSTFKRYETAYQKQSPSKLAPKYPAHFVHQLPPLGVRDRSYMHMRPRSAPADQLSEMCPTPELTPVGGPQKVTESGDRSLSPVNPGSESSGTLSLSDSIGEIFGTKNISSILNVECPRQYILIEDHLPAMAMMLNVELVRLRAVLDLTQRLTHEQILNWPLKLEKPTKD